MFDGLDHRTEAAFVRGLKVAEQTISVQLIAVPGDRPLAVLKFGRAHVLSLWFEEDEPLVWPVDLMHFDSREISEDRWKFVLNCSHID